MAGRIPQPFIDELIARADIVEVIGSRVQLKKAGREWKACCPFHGEKTPSFTVSQTKQFYHCFGCGAHGTAIGFLMEYDKLSFVEAIEELAGRLGLEIPREARANDSKPQSGQDLYELMGRVSQFYCDALKDNQRAIDYLKGRGLSGETAAQFRIGYAPDSWNSVLRGFGEQEDARQRLLAAGLTIERSASSLESDGGYYDRFRDRIMFPIRDARGRVIAFGGRVLDKGEPKYLNSPETPVFHKGKELYGLYEARQARQALKRLLIVEGYMDVVRLHQAGITYALATLGTATTTEHLQRIFRLTSEVVFCFDGDRAGRAAAWRALENALPEAREGREIRFMFLPDGHDPDSLVGEEGREKFEERLQLAVPLHKFLVGELRQRNPGGAGAQSKFVGEAKALIERLPPGTYLDQTLLGLANAAGPAYQREFIAKLGAATTSGRASGSTGSHLGPGRGSVVRQAITLLLNFPDVAKRLDGTERLLGNEQAGVPFLLRMIDDLRVRPAAHKGAVVERWRDEPEGMYVDKLATAECFVTSPQGATQELQTAIERLVQASGPDRRTDELLAKANVIGLTSEERLELQGLLNARNTRQPPAGKP